MIFSHKKISKDQSGRSQLEQGRQSFIFRLLSQHYIVLFLLLQTQEMIVHACLRIVIIGQLRNVGNSFLRLLENGKTNGHIISSLQVLPIRIPEVLLSNVPEKLSVKGAKMAGDKGILSVTVLLFDAVGDHARESYVVLGGKEVAVDEPRAFSLEHGVEQFEDLFSNELIISINDDKDILRLAVTIGSHSKVIHRMHLLAILDKQILRRVQLISTLQELSNIL